LGLIGLFPIGSNELETTSSMHTSVGSGQAKDPRFLWLYQNSSFVSQGTQEQKT
jgi:hypothetical protein